VTMAVLEQQVVLPSPAEPLLEIQGVHKRFGGVHAVDGCAFNVMPGTITGLIGPNGAGKTTLFNLITGVLRLDEGDIRYRGESIAALPPDRVARCGVVRTFQIPRVFSHMTVWENLMFVPLDQPGEAIWRAILRTRQTREVELRHAWRAQEVLEFVGLDHLKDEYAETLSGGQRKLLELARVLMMDPDLILLDEPAAGVNPTLMRSLTERILKLNRRGITFLIIEHDMDVVMSICNPVVVMHHGRTLAEGTPDEIRRNPQVLEAYLGGQV